MVYRDKSKKWEGPFPLVSLEDSTVVAQLPSGRKIFRSTVVKPASTISVQNSWMATQDGELRLSPMSTITDCIDTDAVMFSASEQRHAKPSSEHSFISSRLSEIQGLKNRGAFDVVDREAVPAGTGIYGTRWIDMVKTVERNEIEKSRLVAQNYCDKGATSISTRPPTVSRM